MQAVEGVLAPTPPPPYTHTQATPTHPPTRKDGVQAVQGVRAVQPHIRQQHHPILSVRSAPGAQIALPQRPAAKKVEALCACMVIAWRVGVGLAGMGLVWRGEWEFGRHSDAGGGGGGCCVRGATAPRQAGRQRSAGLCSAAKDAKEERKGGGQQRGGGTCRAFNESSRRSAGGMPRADTCRGGERGGAQVCGGGATRVSRLPHTAQHACTERTHTHSCAPSLFTAHTP